MPGLNGTGPMGQGRMTGRGLGDCSGNYSDAGDYNMRGFGRGYRMGRGVGRGRGCCNRFFSRGVSGRGMGYRSQARAAAPFSESGETELLKERAEILKKELEEIQTKLKTMENK